MEDGVFDQHILTSKDVMKQILSLQKDTDFLFYNAPIPFDKSIEKRPKSQIIRFKRICSIFKYLGIEITSLDDIHYLYDGYLIFTKNYKVDKELDTILKNSNQKEINSRSDLQQLFRKLFVFRSKVFNLRSSAGFDLGNSNTGRNYADLLIHEYLNSIEINIETIDNILGKLLLPNINSIDINMLIEKYNYPTDDIIAIEAEEFKKDIEDMSSF